MDNILCWLLKDEELRPDVINMFAREVEEECGIRNVAIDLSS
jgi:hypothetical protein